MGLRELIYKEGNDFRWSKVGAPTRKEPALAGRWRQSGACSGRVGGPTWMTSLVRNCFWAGNLTVILAACP